MWLHNCICMYFATKAWLEHSWALVNATVPFCCPFLYNTHPSAVIPIIPSNNAVSSFKAWVRLPCNPAMQSNGQGGMRNLAKLEWYCHFFVWREYCATFIRMVFKEGQKKKEISLQCIHSRKCLSILDLQFLHTIPTVALAIRGYVLADN